MNNFNNGVTWPDIHLRNVFSGESENKLERETGNIYDNSSKIHYSNGDRLKTVKTIKLI